MDAYAADVRVDKHAEHPGVASKRDEKGQDPYPPSWRWRLSDALWTAGGIRRCLWMDGGMVGW